MLGSAWRRVQRWFARWWSWLVAALLFVLALVSVRYRRQLKEREDAERRALAAREAERAQTEHRLAGAVRVALRQRAEAAAKRAAEHEGRADQAAEEAQWARKRVDAMSNADVMRAYQRLDKRLAEARRKSKLLAFVAFGVMSLSAQRAQAVDLDMRQDPIEAPHPITGTKGIWLDYDLARDVLADVERLEAMRREVAELRAALEMRRGESKALEDAVTLAEATARASAADAVRSMAIAENERRRARVWWRRPSLWFGLGTVVGAGCVTALAVGVR